jgi:hypothetical protein
VNKKGYHINLDKEAKKDILLFLKLMDNFNGKQLFQIISGVNLII